MVALRPADVASLANAATGFFAIALALQGHAGLAGLALLVGVLLDGADGALARRFGASSVGPQLDTLADATTFVAGALVVGMTVTLAEADPWVAAAAWIVFGVAGLLRLATFTRLEAQGARTSFSGLSTPGAATAVVGALGVGWEGWTLAVVALVAAGLMVAPLRLPKLRGILGLIAVLFILVAMTGTVMGQPLWPNAAMLAGLALYVVAGPLVARNLP